MTGPDFEYGLAQWISYPQWVRGSARIVGDEVILDEDRAELYSIHERADDHIFFELAQLAADRGNLDPREVVSFVRKNGLLWHGADGIGTGECREPLQQWRIESVRMLVLIEIAAALHVSIKEGSASKLREVSERFPEVFTLAPPYGEDQEMIVDTSAQLAEAITSQLEGCELGITSTVYLDTKYPHPGHFRMLQRPPHLLSACYAHLVQVMVDCRPMKECPGCGRVFIPRSAKQKYHAPSCASTNRWRRWKEAQAE